MDESISTFCNTLASFCIHLQTNCDALTQSVQRRPIPLGSASSSFIRGLDRRVSSANDDLNLLESMSFATVSFEELLGHCYEVFKSNDAKIYEIEDRLKDFGYYFSESDDENAEMTSLSTPFSLNPKQLWPDDSLGSLSRNREPAFASVGISKTVKEDPIEAFSLKNLGLSDISIANLASEANYGINEPEIIRPSVVTFTESENDNAADEKHEQTPASISKCKIDILKGDYETLPSYIRCLASWEDLLVAVDKLNKCIDCKTNAGGATYFSLDELEGLGLGPKGRSYLLLLVRMNRLAVETIDGLISYRVT